MTCMKRLVAITLAAGLVACNEPTQPTMIRQLPEQPRLTVGASGAIDLGTLGGTFSAASGVNGLSQVVGYSDIAGDAAKHAYLWQSGTGMIDLGTLGGNLCYAFSLNDLGQVVGACTMAGEASPEELRVGEEGRSHRPTYHEKKSRG